MNFIKGVGIGWLPFLFGKENYDRGIADAYS